MSQLRLGYLYGLGAYVMWGFFPAYFKVLRPTGPFEVLAHRVVWSVLFMVLLLTAVRGWRRIAQLRHRPATLAGIALAGVLIGVNWATYIWAVNIDRVVETSLGYFINPLVVIVAGVVILHERLRAAQWAAVGIGTVAVLVLTVDYGHPPWVALILAFSFAMYGLVKKRLGLPATDGLFVESAVLSLPALALLIWYARHDQLTFGHLSTGHSVLLAAAGVLTAVPLLMFAGAANRLPLVSLGMLQYVAPTLQLALGVFLFHEPMPPVRLFGFGLVWLALAVFTWDGLRTARATRLTAAATPTPTATPARAA
ncbi:EamA family transporter RarD [Catellatospora sp. KI3]|uniref:EamA family transporter RarD n=1 Tax=Catellatospora sp. KI3 TaxID=3041620 RepID=UPI0024832D4B|nr:EamA family transporter RarD [Catellatospora sp. KI3]MDI1461909.1 EamA family transporter RarD [Catellatospora sp. KI3]